MCVESGKANEVAQGASATVDPQAWELRYLPFWGLAYLGRSAR